MPLLLGEQVCVAAQSGRCKEEHQQQQALQVLKDYMIEKSVDQSHVIEPFLEWLQSIFVLLFDRKIAFP